jgi:hypothetical protein
MKNIVDRMTAPEVARRSGDPNAFTIIETMGMTNTMLTELPAVMANDGAVHTSLQRRSYPGGEHRIYNRGVGKKSGQTDPVRNRITMPEAYSDADTAPARHGGNPAALYNGEAAAFLAGMGLDRADDFIYGSHAQNPAEIDGPAARLPAYDGEHRFDFIKETTGSPAPAGSGYSSVYLVAAGPRACHLIYPRGSNSVGVTRRDMGELYVRDADGKEYLAHRDRFTAEYGIAVEHPDAVIRIAGIPAMLNQARRLELIEPVLRPRYRLTKGIVNTVLFANAAVKYQLERAGREAQVVVYPDTDIYGKPAVSINGLRIRQRDAILSAEDNAPAA